MDEFLVFDRPHLMFVEGWEDQAFAERQIESLGLGDLWHIHNMCGKANPWKEVLGFATVDDNWFLENGISISLVQDADNNPRGTITSLDSILGYHGLPQPGGHGTIASNERWRTGIFVMPDGLSNGALEELLLETVPGDRRNTAKEYISEISKTYLPPINPGKNTLLAYFASLEAHVNSISVALKGSSVLPPSHSALAPFDTFIGNLVSSK